MTTQKTLKRRVRARSAKTGESYTAARAQILLKADTPALAPAPDARQLTGMTDEATVRGSGKPIGEWLEILDAWGAAEHKHPEIARWLVSEHGIGGWWAQSVTVAFERARGLRATYERPSGYEVSASRTINASAERISDANRPGQPGFKPPGTSPHSRRGFTLPRSRFAVGRAYRRVIVRSCVGWAFWPS